ncbi:MAG: ribosome small subunit-dependent GTPase A, partial [Burkholderiaceae bacterium]|nr:ribosome small subunit-dependent GTPase A [Burkholderiaceae bacterium]
MADAALLHKGLVVASHGRHVLVERDDGSRLICHPRGKKTQAVVGDRVLWQATQDEGTL